VGNVVCMGRGEMRPKFWSEILKGRGYSEDLGIPTSMKVKTIWRTFILLRYEN
jgi:hypothetical protein